MEDWIYMYFKFIYSWCSCNCWMNWLFGCSIEKLSTFHHKSNLAFWLVLTYDQFEDRCIEWRHQRVLFRWIYKINRFHLAVHLLSNWSQKCGKTSSDTFHYPLVCHFFVFLTHYGAICNQHAILQLSLRWPGACFSSDPVTFRARKAIFS